MWQKLTKKTFPPPGRILLWLDAGRPCGGFPAVGKVERNVIWYWAADKDGYREQRVIEKPEWRYTRWAEIEPPEGEQQND